MRTKIAVCSCGCWYWLGSTDRYGYGQYKFKGRNLIAHREAFKKLTGQDIDGMDLDHLDCPTRRCVRPDHLQAVPKGENARRANETRWHGRKYATDGSATEARSCDRCENRKGTLLHLTPEVLTAEQVRMIRADTTTSARALAARFEVGETTIRDIKARRTWRDLSD